MGLLLERRSQRSVHQLGAGRGGQRRLQARLLGGGPLGGEAGALIAGPAAAGDAHCSDPSKPYCSAGVGKCVQCKAAADCSKETFAKVCNPASGCVECLKDADCTDAMPGSACGNYLCYCTTSSDCASNQNGKICDAAALICTCLQDTDCPTGKTCSKAFAGAKICD